MCKLQANPLTEVSHTKLTPFCNNKDWHGTVALPDLIIQENMYRLRKILTASTTFCRDLPHFYFCRLTRQDVLQHQVSERQRCIDFSINNRKTNIINNDNLQYYLKIFLEYCNMNTGCKFFKKFTNLELL